MTRAQLQAVRRHIIDYANRHIARAGEMRHMMELKREHCAFVARNCRDLALANGWGPEDVNTAEALGLLHDIGRFPQLEEYGTFMDAKSINHGLRGWQAIRESNLLEGVEPVLCAALLDGVLHHNARTVPEHLPEAHYRWINLIRDADRLDIYRIVHDAIINDKLGEHPEIGMGLTLEGDPSPGLAERILAGDHPAYTDLNCFADFLLLILSWVNQMGYPATRTIIHERGIIDQFSAHLPTNIPEVGQVLEQLRTVAGQE
ncbi:hypothetical protein PDESU_05311 [Pontiella desulfatans]|uniref:HD domain-containing protein n=1 Tax=Pontiella desulfatans TaxID=2750659 RepID=A0A6C2U9J4_PONDE|nr:HD domain-containing protein [Pontiella desulfatans]VGO16720.1 hypothetical protein PDESU_05311 [Pontiella desulfatans]